VILWRAARRPYADLSGKGGLLHSGRWHSEGRPVVYTAEHPALALLEVRVNFDLPADLLPDDFMMIKITVPDDIVFSVADMDPRDEVAARRLGDDWLATTPSAILKVPSVIAPESYNYLINPLHPHAVRIAIESISAFSFDARLFR
jgi:RES domain-containing protein